MGSMITLSALASQIGSAMMAREEDFLPVTPFLEAFSAHLAADPDRAACYTVVASGLRLETRSHTFRELARRAWRTWLGLEARGVREGDRVLLCVSQPDHLLSVMLASMAAGFIPVPLPGIGEFGMPSAFLERIRSVASDCQPRLMVVEQRARWEQLRQGTELDIPAVDPLELEAAELIGEPQDTRFPSQPRGQVALLQYTSGSTGSPRGVEVTHENLAANCKAIGRAINATSSDVTVSWLPLHHDMGLVGGLLFPIYWRVPTYILSPMTFMMRPVSWLQAISQFRATFSCAPNFAYNLCTRKIAKRDLAGVDLSSWRVACNGAEPIDATMMRAFIERFSSCGFRAGTMFPVYGLAEATLAVTFPRPGDEPTVDVVDRNLLSSQGRAIPIDPSAANAASFVAVGRTVPGHRVSIIDIETGQPVEERCVGQIVVEGPAVTPRYFGDGTPARTALKTGDLGYLAEGRLYVIDRIKDIIIIAGQNHAPSDIEACAEQVPGVRKGRSVAFSTRNELGTETLHVVAELDPRTWRTQNDIKAEVRRLVNQRFKLGVGDLLLVPPGMLPRTTSGKVRRRSTRDEYMGGRLPESVSLGARVGTYLQQVTRFVVVMRKAR